MEFKPAWWLPSAHLQTLWPFLFRRDVKSLSLFDERFELPDGDFVDLVWVGEGKGPIILILHGFEGSIDSHYVKGLLQKIISHGWRAVFMHFRGCSGEPNRLARSYHSGETGDINIVAKALYEREPHTHFAAVGFSLGGNVLLKWLGETGETNPLKAAIAISVPFELHKTSHRIQKGFSKIYQWYFLKCLRKRLSLKFEQISRPEYLPPLSRLHTLRDFDDKVTAPLHGFLNADEYYLTSSSRQFLKKITVPTLVLHAKDDPFMTQDIIPQENELSQQVCLEVSEKGGHVGFVSGKFPWRAEYWLEKRIPEFLGGHL